MVEWIKSKFEIKEILKYCHTGIKEWQYIEQRPEYKQLQLKL